MVVIAGAGIVTAYDVLQIFVLPANFLTHFGYGPSTILPYQHIADGTNALRFPGTLGGPNQLGTYLILPLTLSLILAIRRKWYLLLTLTALTSLIATYSRAAWLGAIAAVCFVIIRLVPTRFRTKLTVGIGLAAVAALLALPFVMNQNGPLQYFLLHSSVATHDQANLSDSQHVSSLKNGLSQDLKAPLGHGLGTAGPATFHAGQGNIIENYYLQVAYETGWLGLLAFIATLGLLIQALIRADKASPLATAAAAAVIGVSIASLVLPAWTDSSTALIIWIGAGAASYPLRAKNV
jgi:O-antigen ligase